MTERGIINQIVQIGAETVPGTAVAASKKFQNLSLAFTPKPEVKTYRGTGHRWISTAEMNREWSELKFDGPLDYQELVYLLSGVWGGISPVTHPSGTNSKDWAWTPPITGAITPKTFTVQQGDAVRAQQAAYGLFTGFSYKGSRADGFTCEGPMLARAFSDGITMTSSPTAIALAPVVGSHVNVWLDTSSGALGTTQLTRAFVFEYVYDSAFGAFWPLNRSNASFTGHVDTTPKNTVKLTLEADSSGMANYAHLQAGDYMYLRFDAQGPVIETTIHYTITHDMAIKLTNVGSFGDKDGIYVIDYEGEIAEDASWGSGQSQVMTITNLLTGL